MGSRPRNPARVVVSLMHGENRITFFLPCVGKACVVDFALAAVVAAECGVPWTSIVDAAKRVIAPEHRFEVIKRDVVTVIDDSYNINPVGAAVASKSTIGSQNFMFLVPVSTMPPLGPTATVVRFVST